LGQDLQQLFWTEEEVSRREYDVLDRTFARVKPELVHPLAHGIKQMIEEGITGWVNV
jgi:hypothetical protein